MDEHPESPGGLGGDSIPDGPAIRDTRLHRRAIEQRWPMSGPVRVKVLQRLVNIVDPEYDHWASSSLGRPDHREAIAAARALLAADKLNLEQEKLDLVRERAGLDGPAADVAPPRLTIPAVDDRPEQPPPTG